ADADHRPPVEHVRREPLRAHPTAMEKPVAVLLPPPLGAAEFHHRPFFGVAGRRGRCFGAIMRITMRPGCMSSNGRADRAIASVIRACTGESSSVSGEASRM